MPRLCEVCSKEASKYKCPTCGLSSCSLNCTKSHKINCIPKQTAPTDKEAPEGDQQQPEESAVSTEQEENTRQADNFKYSAKVQALFAEYPGLRAKLRDIYRASLEDEWDAAHLGQNHSTNRNERYNRKENYTDRGTWTEEKGFNRGLGRVRKWREMCEGGESTGSIAEGFIKFMTLVVEERENFS